MLTFDAAALAIILNAYEAMPTLKYPLEEYKCMAHAIYHESSNQSLDGMIAVGHVIRTRTYDARWPERVCANINAAQFEYVSKGRTHLSPNNPIDENKIHVSFKLAVHILEGHLPDPTKGADHFYNPGIASPNWADSGYDRVSIEDHDFIKVDW